MSRLFLINSEGFPIIKEFILGCRKPVLFLKQCPMYKEDWSNSDFSGINIFEYNHDKPFHTNINSSINYAQKLKCRSIIIDSFDDLIYKYIEYRDKYRIYGFESIWDLENIIKNMLKTNLDLILLFDKAIWLGKHRDKEIRLNEKLIYQESCCVFDLKYNKYVDKVEFILELYKGKKELQNEKFEIKNDGVVLKNDGVIFNKILDIISDKGELKC